VRGRFLNAMPGKKTKLRTGALTTKGECKDLAGGSGMDAEVEDILFSVASPQAEAELKKKQRPVFDGKSRK
jgi:hypothetical protein